MREFVFVELERLGGGESPVVVYRVRVCLKLLIGPITGFMIQPKIYFRAYPFRAKD